MKLRYLPALLFLLSMSLLAWAVAANPPGGVSWRMLYISSIPLLEKIQFLVSLYLPSMFFAFLGMTLLQVQFRLAMTGASTLTIFSMCTLASLSMIVGIRTAASGPASFPGYALGMALSYTIMSRVYAVTLRKCFGGVKIPWVIWRGNAEAVSKLNRQVSEAGTRNRPTP